MDFYYCVEDGGSIESGNEPNRIVHYVSKPGQSGQHKTVLSDVPMDGGWRRYFVTDDYVVYCKDTYKTFLHNRKTKKDAYVMSTCTRTHFIVDGKVFFSTKMITSH